nr:hypothetical protein [Arthrobacter crystallopoietes]
MHVLAAAGSTGEPTLRPGLDPDQVTPGPWGFFITFGLAVLVILLIWDMQRRIRRVRYREQAAQAAEERTEPAETEQERQRRLDAELNGRITGRKPGEAGEDSTNQRPDRDGTPGS